MPLGSSALMRPTKALDPQPMKVVAVAHLGKGWVSCWMQSGRYTYRKVVVHTTNPDHLIPSAGTHSDRPPLQVALRYREGRCR
jgi:hypothetical protein